MKRKPKTARTLNFNDPTLDETETQPRSVGWSLSEENYPSLARFRFPGIEAPPPETPPAIPARAATREREADPSRKPVVLDAKTVARLRRKARRVLDSKLLGWVPAVERGEALARDLLRVLDGKPGRKP